MAVNSRLLLALALLAGLPVVAIAQTDSSDDAAIEFFEKQVRPILVGNCHTCHSADTNSRGGLRVDDRNGLLEGGSKGPAVVPGKPDESLLIAAVRQSGELKMPQEKKLTDEEIAVLSQWIADGAAWPKPRLPGSIGQSSAEYEKLRKEHWAWQPLGESPVPQVQDAGWPRDDIDRFVLHKLEAASLQPVGDADKQALIRRASFDLTGLPPSPEEIDAFVEDKTAKAFEKFVDRLLASAAYGERWGRHWLDVARYGESTGSARNLPLPHAWRYRDYVIDAFNSDKPYNQFLQEQIAGDLLPATSPMQKTEQLIATGFLALGVKDVNQRFKVRYIMDNVDEQIDAVGRAVLGLTVSCARCHDHKFDPIPTSDYYALAGIFRSSDLCAGLRNKMGGGGLDYYDTQLLLQLSPPQNVEAGRKLEEAKRALEAARAEFFSLRDSKEGDQKTPDGKPKRLAAREKMNKAQAHVQALSDPALHADIAYGIRDAANVSDTEIRIRGEAEKLGPLVSRGFLSVIQIPDQPKINPRQSGRLELSEWLVSPHNPLTTRVIVNRIWHHLFGKGLVKSVDNFGTTGDVPSHPELLDHLAKRFVRDGWSIKRLVRAIVLTRAYQLGSDVTEANVAVDPSNRLIWRHSPRRLDAEEIRDAMLAAAGRLNLSRPPPSPARDFKIVELRNNGPEARRLEQFARSSRHRSVYLPLLRGLTPTSLQAFDFVEQGMVTGSRDTTTVAPQALYLLNDPFVVQQSLAIAERLVQQSDLDDSARIQRACRLTLGRTATSPEIERALAYLADYETAVRESDSTRPVQVAAAKPDPVEKNKTDQTETANPDEPPRTDEPADDLHNQPRDPRTAAWASFCQALLGAAEFRYIR